MRAKSIHPVGVVGKVRWKDLGGHRYSGIFKGAQHGLARLYLTLDQLEIDHCQTDMYFLCPRST